MKIETTPNLNDYKSIKTYEDACDALEEKVPEDELTKAGVPNHIIALMKLELICKALWGGEKEAHQGIMRQPMYFCPSFGFREKPKPEDACHNLCHCGPYLTVLASSIEKKEWGYNGAINCVTNNNNNVFNFRLCLDTDEKAEYFAQQFLELWAEYLAYNLKVVE